MKPSSASMSCIGCWEGQELREHFWETGRHETHWKAWTVTAAGSTTGGQFSLSLHIAALRRADSNIAACSGTSRIRQQCIGLTLSFDVVLSSWRSFIRVSCSYLQGCSESNFHQTCKLSRQTNTKQTHKMVLLLSVWLTSHSLQASLYSEGREAYIWPVWLLHKDAPKGQDHRAIREMEVLPKYQQSASLSTTESQSAGGCHL